MDAKNKQNNKRDNQPNRKAKSPRRSSSVATLDDVAKLADVSPITVSRVIREPHKVAEKTRDKVLLAIDESAYIPNLVASSLASQQGKMVGAIVPTFTNSIFAEDLSGLSDKLADRDYKLLIASHGYSLDLEAELIAAMLAQQPIGLVVVGQLHSKKGTALLKRAKVPIVETWEIGNEPLDMGVGFSNFRACRAMVSELADQGYKKIAFASAPVAANDRAQGRRQGYLAAMGDRHLKIDPGWIKEGHFTLAEGARVLGELIDQHPDIQAIFFASDVLAAGGLFECQRRGIKVPQDLGIAGFDNIDLASAIHPPLTTIAIPRYEIGRKSAELILARIDREPAIPKVTDLGYQLIQRDSTANYRG